MWKVTNLNLLFLECEDVRINFFFQNLTKSDIYKFIFLNFIGGNNE